MRKQWAANSGRLATATAAAEIPLAGRLQAGRQPLLQSSGLGLASHVAGRRKNQQPSARCLPLREPLGTEHSLTKAWGLTPVRRLPDIPAHRSGANCCRCNTYQSCPETPARWWAARKQEGAGGTAGNQVGLLEVMVETVKSQSQRTELSRTAPWPAPISAHQPNKAQPNRCGWLAGWLGGRQGGL